MESGQSFFLSQENQIDVWFVPPEKKKAICNQNRHRLVKPEERSQVTDLMIDYIISKKYNEKSNTQLSYTRKNHSEKPTLENKSLSQKIYFNVSHAKINHNLPSQTSVSTEKDVPAEKDVQVNLPKTTQQPSKKRKGPSQSASTHDDFSFDLVRSRLDYLSVLAFSYAPIGIDIECLNFSTEKSKMLDRAVKIANRYFKKDEKAMIVAGNEHDEENFDISIEQRIETFFRWWTIKEAYTKGKQQPLLSSLKTPIHKMEKEWQWQNVTLNLQNIYQTKSSPNQSSFRKKRFAIK